MLHADNFLPATERSSHKSVYPPRMQINRPLSRSSNSFRLVSYVRFSISVSCVGQHFYLNRAHHQQFACLMCRAPLYGIPRCTRARCPDLSDCHPDCDANKHNLIERAPLTSLDQVQWRTGIALPASRRHRRCIQTVKIGLEILSMLFARRSAACFLPPLCECTIVRWSTDLMLALDAHTVINFVSSPLAHFCIQIQLKLVVCVLLRCSSLAWIFAHSFGLS